MMPCRTQKKMGRGKKLGVGSKYLCSSSSAGLLVFLPCDFFAGPASSPEVMEELVEDEDDVVFLLVSFLVSFFFFVRFPKLVLPLQVDSLLGSVVVGMCTG